MKKSDLLKLIVDLQTRVSKLESVKKDAAISDHPLECCHALDTSQDGFCVVCHKDMSTPGPTIRITSVWTDDRCIDGRTHVYPSLWNGITPPPCKLCGKPANNYTISGNNL